LLRRQRVVALGSIEQTIFLFRPVGAMAASRAVLVRLQQTETPAAASYLDLFALVRIRVEHHAVIPRRSNSVLSFLSACFSMYWIVCQRTPQTSAISLCVHGCPGGVTALRIISPASIEPSAGSSRPF